MPPTRRNPFTKIILVLIAVLVILVGILFLRSGKKSDDSSNENKTTQTTPTPTASVTVSPTGSVTPTMSISPTATVSVTPTTSVTIAPTGTGESKQLKVYFSKNPDSNNDFTYAQWFYRTTKRDDVGTFVLEQVITGPTTGEQALGAFTPLKVSGDSNCSGKDFSLSIGEDKKATLTFCKSVESAGVGDDARVTSVINYNLKQFPTVEKVVILTKDGHCFGDMSGQDQCKN